MMKFKSVVLLIITLMIVCGYSQPMQAAEKSPFVINLDDYAKGDGTDETEAIQRAVDAIQPTDSGENTLFHQGGVLFIPRPKKYYAISKTINFKEKWNVTIKCETPVGVSRGMPEATYFRWIGPDGGTMFHFEACKQIRVENLSMTAMDHMAMTRLTHDYGLVPTSRVTKGVTGILLGPEKISNGFQTSMVFDQLSILYTAVGIKLGDCPENGPDVMDLSFRKPLIIGFSEHAIIANSGNLATTTFETACLTGDPGCKSAIYIKNGSVVFLNMTTGIYPYIDKPATTSEPEIEIEYGGIQVLNAWSEWPGPYLKTSKAVGPEWYKPEYTVITAGSVNYPIILQGVRHYDGRWCDSLIKTGKNPVPISIMYDKQVPLHLIGCSLWGSVELGADSMSTIIDQGTVFINKDCPGFGGEGITRYGRVIHIGTRDPKNARILEPYFVDRRNTPGTKPPATGVWKKGDGIINIDPNPKVPAKAWRGWICIEAGEPGKWTPYGSLKAPSVDSAKKRK